MVRGHPSQRRVLREPVKTFETPLRVAVDMFDCLTFPLQLIRWVRGITTSIERAI